MLEANDLICNNSYRIVNLPSVDEINLPFYINAFGKTENEIDVHWRESTKCFVVYSLKGSGQAFFDNKWHPVPEGSLLYLPIGLPTKYKPADKKPWSTIWFTHSGKSTESTLGDKPFILTDCDLSFIQELFHKMVSVNHEVAPLPEVYACYFYLILKVRELSGKLIKHNPKKSLENKINLSIQYISEHFDEDLTLSKLAGMCYISDVYYCRLFKQLMGCSVTEYIKSLRISRACDILVQSLNEKIENIGKKCGFNTPTYFNRIFKQEKGVSPSEYREKQIKKQEEP